MPRCAAAVRSGAAPAENGGAPLRSEAAPHGPAHRAPPQLWRPTRAHTGPGVPARGGGAARSLDGLPPLRPSTLWPQRASVLRRPVGHSPRYGLLAGWLAGGTGIRAPPASSLSFLFAHPLHLGVLLSFSLVFSPFSLPRRAPRVCRLSAPRIREVGLLVGLLGCGSVGPSSSSPRAGHAVRVGPAGPEEAVGLQLDAVCASDESRTGLRGTAPAPSPA
ncbi:hypothetical protein BS78_K304300 [Paspalum vaginatum]|uniref:Uncharacterized protein n=1 Tax=Paspalum vaginatum TaxID=158149 RepID=A0A9W8CG18_9POAL|nr:hypothetical protein BS78_K304300 [Paspalum vaginatum]